MFPYAILIRVCIKFNSIDDLPVQKTLHIDDVMSIRLDTCLIIIEPE